PTVQAAQQVERVVDRVDGHAAEGGHHRVQRRRGGRQVLIQVGGRVIGRDGGGGGARGGGPPGGRPPPRGGQGGVADANAGLGPGAATHQGDADVVECVEPQFVADEEREAGGRVGGH